MVVALLLLWSMVSVYGPHTPVVKIHAPVPPIAVHPVGPEPLVPHL